MIINSAYIGNPSDENFSKMLNDIHEVVIGKLKASEKNDQAKQIQQSLQAIKRSIWALNQEAPEKSSLIQYVVDQAEQLAEGVFAEQLEVHDNLKSFTKLFQRSHNKVKSAIGDDIVEEELASMLSYGSNNYTTIDFTVGQMNATSPVVEALTKDTENRISEGINLLAENMGKKITKQVVNKKTGKLELKQIISTNVTAKAGKADLTVPASLEINMDAHPLIQAMVEAMKGYNFSVKNYKSTMWDDKKKTSVVKDFSTATLGFGNSNLYKAVTGGLSQYSEDVQFQDAVFFRGLQYLLDRTIPPDTSNITDVQRHFAHLKAIYEIKGSGQVWDLDPRQSLAADFVIWNDPDSQNIYVRDVNSLITSVIEDSNMSTLFGDIRVTFNKFLRSNQDLTS